MTDIVLFAVGNTDETKIFVINILFKLITTFQQRLDILYTSKNRWLSSDNEQTA